MKIIVTCKIAIQGDEIPINGDFLKFVFGRPFRGLSSGCARWARPPKLVGVDLIFRLDALIINRLKCQNGIF